MSRFRALHLRRLREHPGRAVLSLTGVAAGSLLIVAVLSLFASLTGSLTGLAHLAGDAVTEVDAPTGAGISLTVAGAVARAPGVGGVTPIVRTLVAVDGHDALLVGADAGSAVAGGLLRASCFTSLSPLALAGTGPPVVVGARLARVIAAHAGSDIAVYGNGGTAHATVAGVLSCPSAATLDNGMFVATTLGAAETLAGRPGRIDSVFVGAARGASGSAVTRAVQAAVGDQAVVTSPSQRVRLATKTLQPIEQSLSFAIFLVLVVAGFLVFNTMSMAALERRRELATLRALGGRRRPLLLGFLGEAAILGLAGSAIGALGGIFVARAALARVPAIYLDLLGVKPRFVLPATAIPAAVVIGTLASVVAAAVPGRTAVRVPPVEAMRPEGVLEVADTGARVRPVVTTLGAVILVAGTLVMVLGSKSLVSVGFGATTVGVLILTFGVSGLIAVGVARLAARIGAVGRLAAAGIERAPRRVWATTLAVTIGVAIVVALGGLVSNQNETFAADFHSMTESAFWVQAGAADSIPTQAQLPSGWVAQIRAIPGVGAVRHNESAYIALNDEQVLLDGLDPGSNVPFVRGAGPAGPRALNGDGVIAAKSWAKRHGMHVGDAVTIATPSGRQSPRIVALSDVPDPVQGELAVDYTRFAQWFRGGALTAIEVAVPSRADLAAVQSSLVRLVATAPVAIHVYTGAEEWAGARKSLTQITAIFTAVVWVIVLATALAVLNTMAITVVERRRELGILRAVGTSRGMISRMVLVEAAVITVSGLAMGVLLGLLQQAAGIRATATVTGFTVRYRLVIAPLVTAAIAAAVMTVGGAIGPAWRAARVDVIPAIGYE